MVGKGADGQATEMGRPTIEDPRHSGLGPDNAWIIVDQPAGCYEFHRSVMEEPVASCRKGYLDITLVPVKPPKPHHLDEPFRGHGDDPLDRTDPTQCCQEGRIGRPLVGRRRG